MDEEHRLVNNIIGPPLNSLKNEERQLAIKFVDSAQLIYGREAPFGEHYCWAPFNSLEDEEH